MFLAKWQSLSGKMRVDPTLMMTVAFGFSIGSGYMLMPVRDVQVSLLGKSNTWKLIMASTLFSLPLSTVSKRMLRDNAAETASSIANFYRLYWCIILLGYLLLPDGQTTGLSSIQVLICAGFYVVSESFKLLSVSLLWSFVADSIASTRVVALYSAFGLSCTVGQTAASFLSWFLLSSGLKPTMLLLIVAVCLEVTARAVVLAGKMAPAKTRVVRVEEPKSQRVGIWEGLKQTVLADVYLCWICVYTLGYTATMYMIYIDRISILEEAKLTSEEGAAFTAQINVAASVATCILQLLLTTAKFEDLLGVTAGLYALPGVTLLGFVLLTCVWRIPAVIACFEVSRRVTAFAVSKPCREALYTVVSREKKYTAKSVIDTFIYRLGGSAGAVLYSYLASFRIDNGPTDAEKLAQLLVVSMWLVSTWRLTELRSSKQKLLKAGTKAL